MFVLIDLYGTAYGEAMEERESRMRKEMRGHEMTAPR